MNRFLIGFLVCFVALSGVSAFRNLEYILEVFPSTRAERADGAMRSVAIALESYDIDNNFYPAPTNTGHPPEALTKPVSYLFEIPDDVYQVEAPTDSFWQYLWLSHLSAILVGAFLGGGIMAVELYWRRRFARTIRMSLEISGALVGMCCFYLMLTILGHPREPFVKIEQSAPPFYWSDGSTWILQSTGPNRIRDLETLELPPFAESWRTPQAAEILTKYTYDPSNGTHSSGDLFRMH